MAEKPNAHGWYLSDNRDFRSGIEMTDTHSGGECVYFKSVVALPKTFGFLSKSINAEGYVGKRIKLSAWVKTNLPEGASAQLWLRVDGDWKERTDCFDNMFDSRIKGVTDWSLYEVAVNVPPKSKEIVFGILLNGTGQVWLDETMLETLQEDAILAGRATKQNSRWKALQEMTAEDDAAGLTFKE